MKSYQDIEKITYLKNITKVFLGLTILTLEENNQVTEKLNYCKKSKEK